MRRPISPSAGRLVEEEGTAGFEGEEETNTRRTAEGAAVASTHTNTGRPEKARLGEGIDTL